MTLATEETSLIVVDHPLNQLIIVNRPIASRGMFKDGFLERGDFASHVGPDGISDRIGKWNKPRDLAIRLAAHKYRVYTDYDSNEGRFVVKSS